MEVVDVWEMSRETVGNNMRGQVRVPLPGKEGIGILVTRKFGKELAEQ